MQTALQLGRDATTFRSTIDGLLDGSAVMQVTAEQNPEVRALLGAIKTRFGTGSSEQTQLASDALMHTQRIGKAAPNAIQGNVEAFAQLEERRQLLNRDLNLLAKGGALDGATIALPPSGMARWASD